MTQAVVIEPVRKSFEVELPPPEAFQLFASDMAVWWPATHHIGPSPFIEIVIELGIIILGIGAVAPTPSPAGMGMLLDSLVFIA